jgi:uncharacterized protein
MSENDNELTQQPPEDFPKGNVGEMAWIDLSVPNAGEIKKFYQSVIGWECEAVSMGDYDDYSMNSPETGEPITGICHAKGVNLDLPATWLPYFLVADIEHSVAQVTAQGGELLTPIKPMGDDKYVVLKDPAGAICALYQKK